MKIKDELIKRTAICGIKKTKFLNCKFPEKHRYRTRIHYPNQNASYKTKTLKAETYNDAVVEAINYEENFYERLKKDSVDSDGKLIKRYYLFNTQVKYINFLNDRGVPEHKKANRSEKHIKEIYKCLLLFNESLILKKINIKTLLVIKVSDSHVGYFHTYLLKYKGYQNKTYNNKMSALKAFFKWANKEYKLKMDNPFEDVKLRSTSKSIDTISEIEYNKLLEIISPEKGYVMIGVKNPKRKNRYKSYLKDGIELALHTGGRREEIVELKWDMIKEVENRPTYILVPNLKVERQKGKGFNDNVPPKIIPVTTSLNLLLHRLGYEEKKGSHEYILCPDRSKITTLGIMENLSKGFSHFFDLLDTGRKLQLKHLRKTYLTHLQSVMGTEAKLLSSHSTDDVLKKHYIDQTVINKAVKDLKIF
ncbi:hypothetical protein [uncultured Kordia sp.]|uniref:hypothetical protein n=1 Tax=uncultured Kordia sp. TaxID=507699 RepID=UPI00261DB04C|nr:hypothetical protein [uncultured Kordia sp.]